MQIRKAFSILLTLLGIAAFAPQALAQSPLFSALTPPQPHEAGKVEVIEFFWYGCPHCYAIESSVNAWVKSKPADVVFKRDPQSPMSFAGRAKSISRIRAALELVGCRARNVRSRSTCPPASMGAVSTAILWQDGSSPHPCEGVAEATVPRRAGCPTPLL